MDVDKLHAEMEKISEELRKKQTTLRLRYQGILTTRLEPKKKQLTNEINELKKKKEKQNKQEEKH